MSGENPFGDFDEDWQGTPEAPKGGGLGRIAPGTYKVIMTAVDLGNGEPAVDHEVIDNREKGKSLGLKVFAEVVSPEKVKNLATGEEEITKGKIIEHVFWVTQNTLGYVKRDVKTIVGRDLKNAGELMTVQWAGHTAEVGVRDEEYNGYMNSKVSFWNKWEPKGKVNAPAAPKAPSAGRKLGKVTAGSKSGAASDDVAF